MRIHLLLLPLSVALDRLVAHLAYHAHGEPRGWVQGEGREGRAAINPPAKVRAKRWKTGARNGMHVTSVQRHYRSPPEILIGSCMCVCMGALHACSPGHIVRQGRHHPSMGHSQHSLKNFRFRPALASRTPASVLCRKWELFVPHAGGGAGYRCCNHMLFGKIIILQ